MKEKPLIAVLATAALVALAVYFFFFAPLIKESRARHSEYKSLESELSRARDMIKFAGKTRADKVLLTAADVSVVIDELARCGKSTGVNLVALRPQEIIGADQAWPECDILPIDMEIESTYEQLGRFLGALDKLQKGLIKVKSFTVLPGGEYRARLKTKLVADIYFLKRKPNGE
jgi:Tfp pilus assembly protein PilO